MLLLLMLVFIGFQAYRHRFQRRTSTHAERLQHAAARAGEPCLLSWPMSIEGISFWAFVASDLVYLRLYGAKWITYSAYLLVFLGVCFFIRTVKVNIRVALGAQGAKDYVEALFLFRFVAIFLILFLFMRFAALTLKPFASGASHCLMDEELLVQLIGTLVVEMHIIVAFLIGMDLRGTGRIDVSGMMRFDLRGAKGAVILLAVVSTLTATMWLAIIFSGTATLSGPVLWFICVLIYFVPLVPLVMLTVGGPPPMREMEPGTPYHRPTDYNVRLLQIVSPKVIRDTTASSPTDDAMQPTLLDRSSNGWS